MGGEMAGGNQGKGWVRSGTAARGVGKGRGVRGIGARERSAECLGWVDRGTMGLPPRAHSAHSTPNSMAFH